MDAKTEIGDLYLKFKGKKPSLYRYADVPKEVVMQFMDAPSKGKFVGKFITPHYTATRMPLDGEEVKDTISRQSVKKKADDEPKAKPVIRTGHIEL